MKEKNKGLGSRIREIRKQLVLSQTALGEVLGVGTSAVSAYEKGESSPSPDNLVKIAELGKVSLDWLLTGMEKPAGWVVDVQPEKLGYPPIDDEPENDGDQTQQPDQVNEHKTEHPTGLTPNEEFLIEVFREASEKNQFRLISLATEVKKVSRNKP